MTTTSTPLRFPSKARLASIDIVNPHNLCRAGGGRIYISYRPYQSRSPICDGWLVKGLNFKTDPEAHWADYGSRLFTGSGSSKEEALLTAQAWASEQYGIQQWIRDPFGAYQDVQILERVREMAKKVKDK